MAEGRRREGVHRLEQLGERSGESLNPTADSALDEVASLLENDETPLAVEAAKFVDVDGALVPGVTVLTDRRLLFCGGSAGRAVLHDVPLRVIKDVDLPSRRRPRVIVVHAQGHHVELVVDSDAVAAGFVPLVYAAIATRQRGEPAPALNLVTPRRSRRAPPPTS